MIQRLVEDKINGKGFYEAKFSGEVLGSDGGAMGVLRRASAYRMQANCRSSSVVMG